MTNTKKDAKRGRTDTDESGRVNLTATVWIDMSSVVSKAKENNVSVIKVDANETLLKKCDLLAMPYRRLKW